MRRPSMSITGKHELKEGELDGIRQLKQTFPDIDSSTLLRFYRARKGHVQNATDMLIDNIKWRQETFPVSFDRVREECAKGKYVLAGRDKEGDLVLYLMGHKMGPHTCKSIEDHMDSVFFMLEIVASEILVRLKSALYEREPGDGGQNAWRGTSDRRDTSDRRWSSPHAHTALFTPPPRLS